MIKKISLLALVALSLSACSDDFVTQNDPNAVNATDFFKTENDVLQAVKFSLILCVKLSERLLAICW